MITGKLFLLFAPLFVLMVVAELIWSRAVGKGAYTWRETLATVAIAAPQNLLTSLASVVTLAASAWVWEHRIATVPLNTAWGVALLILAVEFAYYWIHRGTHEVRWMWASHFVHHTVTELNVLSSYRLGWTNVISGGWLFFLPLSWVGFHPAAVALTAALNLFYQSWTHTTLIPRLGWFDYWFNSPANHRVHHASNPRYLDRNYGGVLMVFDHLFGTYQAELADEPCRFGVTNGPERRNILAIVFHEWRGIAGDVVRHPGHWRGYMFGVPGWSHDGRRKTSSDLRREALAAASAVQADSAPT